MRSSHRMKNWCNDKTTREIIYQALLWCTPAKRYQSFFLCFSLANIFCILIKVCCIRKRCKNKTQTKTCMQLYTVKIFFFSCLILITVIFNRTKCIKSHATIQFYVKLSLFSNIILMENILYISISSHYLVCRILNTIRLHVHPWT